MAGKIQIALVGCGNRGQQHCEAVRTLAEDFELVGVCDTMPERVKKYAERFGVEAYESFERLLQRPGLDAVIISTTTDVHAAQALACSAAKKHFVIEKPLCDSIAMGKKMEAAAKAAGVVGMTGYQRTYQQYNRELIRHSQEIRALQVVSTAQRGFFMPQFFVPEMYGGIMDALTHDIDIGLRAVGGEPVGVFAQMRRGVYRPAKGAIEFVNILVDLDRDGERVMANFSASMGCHKPKNIFQAIGAKGFVVSSGGEIVVMRHEGFADSKEPINPASETVKSENDAKFALERLYKNFAQAIRGEAANESTLRHGLRALAVMQAAAESAGQGRYVAISL